MLGVDCSKMDGPTVPIVYSVSFSDPAGYFLATRMQMHNKDVIFAANAQAVEITKFAAFVNTLISVPSNIGALGITWQSLRIISGSSPASSGAAVVTTPVVVSSPPH
jgi:polysaccharide export outer membrane protein